MKTNNIPTPSEDEVCDPNDISVRWVSEEAVIGKSKYKILYDPVEGDSISVEHINKEEEEG